jgi:hypothetical protein
MANGPTRLPSSTIKHACGKRLIVIMLAACKTLECQKPDTEKQGHKNYDDQDLDRDRYEANKCYKALYQNN